MTNRLRPIHRPADCAGMTVRLQPNVIHEELIRSWGAVPVAVELSAGIQLITRLDVDALGTEIGSGRNRRRKGGRQL